MDDDAFLRDFESGALRAGLFHHRDHLRMAWLYIVRDGREGGVRNAVAGLRHFAAVKGVSHLYLETLTRFWVGLVGHVVSSAPPAASTFDACLAGHPWLADKTLPFRHYRPETLDGTPARAAWVEPNVLPLPD